jgi:hypothetical protein
MDGNCRLYSQKGGMDQSTGPTTKQWVGLWLPVADHQTSPSIQNSRLAEESERRCVYVCGGGGRLAVMNSREEVVLRKEELNTHTRTHGRFYCSDAVMQCRYTKRRHLNGTQ